MTKRFQCRHEDGCSEGDQYWQYRNHVVIMDERGNIVEEVVGDEQVKYAICTECGAGANLLNEKAVEIHANGKAEGADQMMMAL